MLHRASEALELEELTVVGVPAGSASFNGVGEGAGRLQAEAQVEDVLTGREGHSVFLPR